MILRPGGPVCFAISQIAAMTARTMMMQIGISPPGSNVLNALRYFMVVCSFLLFRIAGFNAYYGFKRPFVSSQDRSGEYLT
jgi:hypothetical protein